MCERSPYKRLFMREWPDRMEGVESVVWAKRIILTPILLFSLLGMFSITGTAHRRQRRGGNSRKPPQLNIPFLKKKDSVGATTNDTTVTLGPSLVVQRPQHQSKMVAELFLTGAFFAGVIEGRSTLRNAKKESQSSWPPGPFLFIPSLLYGTVALPMSIIGASPGDKIVSWFPFCPPLQPQLEHNSSADGGDQNQKTTPSQQQHMMDIQDVNSLGRGGIQSTHHNSMNSMTSRKDQFGATESSSPPAIMDKRSEWIQKSREQNRKALAERQQQQLYQQQQKIASVKVESEAPKPKAATTTTTKVLPPRKNSYFATLDGRPLSTPVAEAMRRCRVLLVTAGLITAAWTYQQQVKEEEAESKLLQRQGRDAQAVRRYVSSHPKNDGVAIRLVESRPSIDLKSHAPWFGTNVVPFSWNTTTNNDGMAQRIIIDTPVHTDSMKGDKAELTTPWSVLENAKDIVSMENAQKVLDQIRYDPDIPLPDQFVKFYSLLHDMAMNFKQHYEQTKAVSHPYWHLGRTWNEWSQIPLSQDWLLQPDEIETKDESSTLKSSAPLLVLEADVSLPLSSCFEHQSQRRKTLPIVDYDTLETTRNMSRIIQTIGQQKGVVAKPEDATAGSAPSLLTVFVASISADVKLQSPATAQKANELFVSGLDATASEVTLWAESKHEKLQEAFLKSVKMENEENKVSEEEKESSTFVLVSLIDYIGEKIRQSGEIILRSFTAPCVPKVLHVFSDQRNASDWLRAELYSKGWIVEWHDISSDDGNLVQIYNRAMNNGGFAVVCRNTDEKTCDFVSAIFSSSSKVDDATTELFVLLDRASSESTVNGLADDSSQAPGNMTTLSLARIHNNLFREVRKSFKHDTER